jgi:hypothetical protein
MTQSYHETPPLDKTPVPRANLTHEQHSYRRRGIAWHQAGLTLRDSGDTRKTGSSRGPFLLSKMTI